MKKVKNKLIISFTMKVKNNTGVYGKKELTLIIARKEGRERERERKERGERGG